MDPSPQAKVLNSESNAAAGVKRPALLSPFEFSPRVKRVKAGSSDDEGKLEERAAIYPTP
ncbi:hypothetical protein RUND412_011155, partial [Rhizina undulata]